MFFPKLHFLEDRGMALLCLYNAAFNTIVRHIFPENFVEIPQVGRMLKRFSSPVLTYLRRQHITADVNIFYLQPTLYRFFNNCIKLC